jgi:hypothetical protein
VLGSRRMVGSVRLLEEKTAAFRARIHIILTKYITPNQEIQVFSDFFFYIFRYCLDAALSEDSCKNKSDYMCQVSTRLPLELTVGGLSF